MTDIFSDDNTANDRVKADDLVGEGKKFATVDDLAKGKAESDAFINRLQEELKGLRDELTRSANANDNLAELQKEIAALKAAQSAEPRSNTSSELTTEKLEEIVTSVITKQEQSRTANQNIATANSEMIKQFGDKAKEVFEQKASAIGMSVADLKAIASKSPTAFYQIVGINPDKAVDVRPDLQSSKVNTAAMPDVPGALKKGTAAYYNKIRREMGNAKFFADTKLQAEIWEHKKAGTYDS